MILLKNLSENDELKTLLIIYIIIFLKYHHKIYLNFFQKKINKDGNILNSKWAIKHLISVTKLFLVWAIHGWIYHIGIFIVSNSYNWIISEIFFQLWNLNISFSK